MSKAPAGGDTGRGCFLDTRVGGGRVSLEALVSRIHLIALIKIDHTRIS